MPGRIAPAVDIPPEPFGAEDGWGVMDRIAEGASWLSLGSGSAPDNWWQ